MTTTVNTYTHEKSSLEREREKQEKREITMTVHVFDKRLFIHYHVNHACCTAMIFKNFLGEKYHSFVLKHKVETVQSDILTNSNTMSDAKIINRISMNYAYLTV